MATGDLGLYGGELAVKLYYDVKNPKPVRFMQLASPGHGWFEIPAKCFNRIAESTDYRLVAIQSGVLSGDLGKILTAEQLRAALDNSGKLAATGVGLGDTGVRRRMHHCSFVDCPHKRVLI